MAEPAEHEHIVSKKVYIAVFLTLWALTLVTTLVAFLDLGPLNTPVALLIAGIKMALVVLFFMHLRYSGRLSQTIAIAGLFWFLIFVTFTVGDYLTRPWPS
jgi:cytochrome c oxidase subunit IV